MRVTTKPKQVRPRATTKAKTAITGKKPRSKREQVAYPLAEARNPRQARWYFRLYIADEAPASLIAIANLKKLCTEHLQGRCRIRVIDLTQNPQIACEDGIVAIPTLVRKLPLPIKVTIGDLSNTDRLLKRLGIYASA